MPNPTQEQEYREEAERLKALPLDVQRQIIAMHRTDADNPKVPKADREYARERMEVLEKLLGLAKRKR